MEGPIEIYMDIKGGEEVKIIFTRTNDVTTIDNPELILEDVFMQNVSFEDYQYYVPKAEQGK